MNAFELLQKWPSWERAGAGTIFDSPAWAMPVRWKDIPCVLRRSGVTFRDVLGISVRLDDEENFLGICNREAFPDLHTLWDVKNNLPDALKLALVEKECGPLFQILENALRRQLNVLGVAPAENREGTTGFELIGQNGKPLVSFVLKVDTDMVRTLGLLKYIDLNHDSILSMERAARAVYASFTLEEEEIAGLAAGDYLMLPEIGSSQPTWQVEDQKSEMLQVCAPDTMQITFGQFASEELPEIPKPNELILMRRGKILARGRIATLVQQPAFALEEIL